ncbi:MAG: hypothetical protein RLZZ381_990, partial [Cyanobacteriota bacterium]
IEQPTVLALRLPKIPQFILGRYTLVAHLYLIRILMKTHSGDIGCAA